MNTNLLPWRTAADENYRGVALYLISFLFIVVDFAQTVMLQVLAPGMTVARLAGLVGLAFFIAAPIIFRVTGKLTLPSIITLGTAFVTITVSAFYNGGAPAPTFLFFVLMPLFAAILLGRNGGLVFLALSATAVLLCTYTALTSQAPPSPHSQEAFRTLFVSATLLTLVAVTLFVMIYESVVTRAMNALSAANDKLQIQADELRESKEYLATVMESVSDGIVAADASGRLSVFNRAARNFHGIDARSIASQDWASEYNLYHPDGKTNLNEDEIPLFRALQGEKVTASELVIISRDQQARRLISNASPLYNDRKELIGAMATMRDVTTEKAQSEEIRRQNLELTQFSRVASIDLQAPLKRIINASEVLQESLTASDATNARDELLIVSKSAEKMGVLIRDVLYMSRLPIGELSMQSVSPRECMEAAIDLSGLTEADCRFDFRFAQAPDVFADPHTLTNVFRNLVLNASRIAGDENRRHIEFTCALDGDFLIAGVKDNGNGDPAEDADSMFLPLERLHTETDQDGTGLALAISRKSIERMGGEIWAETEPGAGCHIKFRLPLADNRQALAS